MTEPQEWWQDLNLSTLSVDTNFDLLEMREKDIIHCTVVQHLSASILEVKLRAHSLVGKPTEIFERYYIRFGDSRFLFGSDDAAFEHDKLLIIYNAWLCDKYPEDQHYLEL